MVGNYIKYLEREREKNPYYQSAIYETLLWRDIFTIEIMYGDFKGKTIGELDSDELLVLAQDEHQPEKIKKACEERLLWLASRKKASEPRIKENTTLSPNAVVDNPKLEWFGNKYNLLTLPLSQLYDMQNWKLSDRQKAKIEYFIKVRTSGGK